MCSMKSIPIAINVYNPLGALHQLLEPRQAKRFKDLSLPTLPLDASHVIWVATGNDIDAIEKPILDRFVVFEIEKPSAAHMRTIAQSVYQRVLERYKQTERFEAQLVLFVCYKLVRWVRPEFSPLKRLATDVDQFTGIV